MSDQCCWKKLTWIQESFGSAFLRLPIVEKYTLSSNVIRMMAATAGTEGETKRRHQIVNPKRHRRVMIKTTRRHMTDPAARAATTSLAVVIEGTRRHVTEPAARAAAASLAVTVRSGTRGNSRESKIIAVKPKESLNRTKTTSVTPRSKGRVAGTVDLRQRNGLTTISSSKRRERMELQTGRLTMGMKTFEHLSKPGARVASCS